MNKTTGLFFISFTALCVSFFSAVKAYDATITADPLVDILFSEGLEVTEFLNTEENPFHLSSPVFTDDEIAPIIVPKKDEKCSVPAEVPAEIENIFHSAIKDIPCEMLQSLYIIEIFDDPHGEYPRAMANSRILKINRYAIDRPEFMYVLQHEIGHIIDLGYFQSESFTQPSGYKDGQITIYEDDPSTDFYTISWNTDGSQKQNISETDFVGGYASSDMFEDFAESFLMYIKHGKEFRILAQENQVLAQKYAFIKHEVFNGKEFETGKKVVYSDTRAWDITKM